MKSKYGYDTLGRFVNLETGNLPTAEESNVAEVAHAAVIRADQQFHAALVRTYRERAGDMRYQTNQLPASLKVLALAYQAAMERWRATWRVND